MQPLTPKQQALYDWIVQYFINNQRMPAFRDMQRHFNSTSPAPIQSLLDNLQKKGWIDRVKGDARSLRLVGYRIELVQTEPLKIVQPPKPKRGMAWHKQSAAIALHQQQYSNSEIADELGISLYHVRKLLSSPVQEVSA